jgi:hypothetical protein
MYKIYISVIHVFHVIRKHHIKLQAYVLVPRNNVRELPKPPPLYYRSFLMPMGYHE